MSTNVVGSIARPAWTALARRPETLADVVDGMAVQPGRLVFCDGQDGRPAELALPHWELAAEAGRAAAVLEDLGVRPGDRVGLLAPTSPGLVISLLATWRAGAIPTVLPFRKRRPDQVAARLGAVAARAVVTDGEFAALVGPEPGGARVVRFDELLASGPAASRGVRVTAGDVALLQFTSGSTARPRAVTLTHATLLFGCGLVPRTLGMASGQTWVSWLPLYHDMGLITFVASLVTGASMHLTTPEQFVNRPGWWLDTAARHGCYGTAAPTFGLRLAALDLRLNPRPLDLSRLEVVLTGAEPIDHGALQAFAGATAPAGLSPHALCPGYGLAEATLGVTSSRPGEPVRSYVVHRQGLEPGGIVRLAEPGATGTRRLVSCGGPIPDTDVRVVDDAGDAVPPWRVGEIAVRSPAVMAGYWSAPEATAEVLAPDGWLRTGDLGFLAERGDLVVCGRIKDMIIVGGHNVYPEEYESAAQRVDGVRSGGVVAFSVPEIERMVVVAEMSRRCDDPEGLARRLMSALREDVAHAPEEVVVVGAGGVPRTTSGKLQRRLCCRLYVSGELSALGTARRQGG